jgi:hypothetical protein
MGFYEDDRIRRKNQPEVDCQPSKQPIRLELGDNCSLAKVLETLKDAKFKVSLRGKNTVVIE